MSRNDQLLVKEYKGKFYVFDVMAESWGEWDEKNNKPISNKNKLPLSESRGVYDTREEAHEAAHKIDAEDEWFGSEYGVVDEVLYKDGASVEIVEDDERTLLHDKEMLEVELNQSKEGGESE